MPKQYNFKTLESGDTLHPVVQLRLGTVKERAQHEYINRTNTIYNKQPLSADSWNFESDFLLTIPPNNLIEFTDVTMVSGADHVTISFIDSTFGSLEQQIFKTDRKYGGRILYRWGYPGKGLEGAKWRTMIFRDYVPTITSSGVRITITGISDGFQAASIAEPTVYYGKISTVIRTIAKELGFDDETKVFIEETDDDIRESDKKAEWPTSNMTRIDLIYQKLLPEAKSKVNPNGSYQFVITSDGTFHFHTQFFKKNIKAKIGSESPITNSKETVATDSSRFRRFNVMQGIPTGVISFSPRYTGSGIGQFAAETIACVYDPRTKQFIQSPLNRRTLGMESDYDPKGGGRTTAAPISKENDDPATQRRKAESYTSYNVKQVALGGHCSGKAVQQYHGPEMALKRMENAWKYLQNYVCGATLELVGLPEFYDFVASEMYCEIAVVLPSGVEQVPGQPTFQTAQGSLHWSSGRYQIDTITHSISSDYKIIVELRRPTGLEGTASAETGPPQPANVLTTGVAR